MLIWGNMKQEARDAWLRDEAARQEKRFKALQHQFQLLQLEVQARTSPTPEPIAAGPDPGDWKSLDAGEQDVPAPAQSSGQSRFHQEPRLEKLTEIDDIEHFLVTFERMAASCRWPKRDWAFCLIPLLTGKARSAYVHMDMDDVDDYECVKEAILCKYDINPETYRQRFRSTDIEPRETPKELYARLKELFGKWIQPKLLKKLVKSLSWNNICACYLLSSRCGSENTTLHQQQRQPSWQRHLLGLGKKDNCGVTPLGRQQKTPAGPHPFNIIPRLS